MQLNGKWCIKVVIKPDGVITLVIEPI